MTEEDALKFAFAVDGLIRSRMKGDGGEEFARKCIREMAEALTTKKKVKK